MNRGRIFGKFGRLLKERLLLVGLSCAFLVLLLLLLIQFQSLSLTQRKSALANTLLVESYLEEIAREARYEYRLETEKILSVPPSVFRDENLLSAYFAKQKWRGAKFYFALASENFQAVKFFPLQTNVALSEHIGRVFQSRKEKFNQNDLIVDESNRQARVVLKILTDDTGRFLGAVGLVLDNEFFVNQKLPEIIKEKRGKFFANEYGETVIVTVLDNDNRLIFESRPESAGFEENINVPFEFVFKDWQLRARNTVVSQDEWSRQIFRTNIFVSCLLAAFLLLAFVIALRALKRQVELSRMKSDFVANVSHELKTPLTSIRVYGELLGSGWISGEEKLRECGAHIENETRRLVRLIDNILDFSKIEAGQKRYKFEPGDLRQTIKQTLQLLEPQLEKEGFRVEFESDEFSLAAVPAHISFDREAIQQVLVNLIANAAKYSTEEKRISVSLSVNNRNRAVICVRDWGIGIAQEEQKRIFEKFHRVGNNLTHDVKGSGLGLAIVQHIIAAHGGSIEVKSGGINRGSTFSIFLPHAENGNGK